MSYKLADRGLWWRANWGLTCKSVCKTTKLASYLKNFSSALVILKKPFLRTRHPWKTFTTHSSSLKTVGFRGSHEFALQHKEILGAFSAKDDVLRKKILGDFGVKGGVLRKEILGAFSAKDDVLRKKILGDFGVKDDGCGIV